MARLFKTPVTVEGVISTNNVIASTQSSGDEGGQIDLTKAATNTTLTTGVTLDVFQNRLRIFETGGTNRGYYLDISAGGTSAATNIIGTASAVSNTVTGTNSADLVYGNMADNDQFRIRVGGTATNAGFVEIATADDGTEPIYVRQYTGVFTTLARTATILDGSGNTSFPGTVTGTTFSGSGASLTSIPAANVTGTLTSTVLGNSSVFIGTTSVALNRTSANLALTGISSITLPGSTSGTAQIIPTAAAGTGTVITLPATTGTVALTANKLSVFAATTSSELLGVISDETGSGALVFGTTPTITPADAVAATSATTAGFMGMPQNAKTASYTLVASDAGKHIYFSGSTASQTITIPANGSVGYQIGTAITFINLATVSVSIAITTDTMYLAGPGTTGTRTLAAYGMATAVKITATSWIISGNGLT